MTHSTISNAFDFTVTSSVFVFQFNSTSSNPTRARSRSIPQLVSITRHRYFLVWPDPAGGQRHERTVLGGSPSGNTLMSDPPGPPIQIVRLATSGTNSTPGLNTNLLTTNRFTLTAQLSRFFNAICA